MCGRDERSVPGYSTPSRSTLKSFKTRISYTALSATHCQPPLSQSVTASLFLHSVPMSQTNVYSPLSASLPSPRQSGIIERALCCEQFNLHHQSICISFACQQVFGSHSPYPQAQACLATPLRWHDPSYKLLQSIMLLPTSSLGSSPLATPVRSRRSLPLHGMLFL